MWPIVKAVTAFFDGLIGLFGGMHPFVGLSVVSILTGAVMLVVWKFTSNQKAIAAAKSKISAYIYEIRIFQEDMGLQMAAQRKAFLANMKYLSLAVPPLIVVLLPVVAILVQLDVRYERRPLLPGESTLLKVMVSESVDPGDVTLEVPAGIAISALPVRIPREHEVDWRLRAENEGEYDLQITVAGETVTKRIVVGDKITKIAEGRDQAGILAVWLAPAEKPIPKGSAFQAISFQYPDRDTKAWGYSLHWLLVFFVVSVLFGFAIKGVVGVEV